MKKNEKTIFFDGIAHLWDGWEDLKVLHEKLTLGFLKLAIKDDEIVLDVGCGTGNLTQALLSRLGAKGQIVAIDISKAMLEVAKSKVNDARVTFCLADASAIPEQDATFDRIVCYSVWPHFDDTDGVVKEFRRLLRPLGYLHVWHLNSRKAINAIHAGAGDAVKQDVLAPAEEVATDLEQLGFKVLACIDDERQYLVSAQKF